MWTKIIFTSITFWNILINSYLLIIKETDTLTVFLFFFGIEMMAFFCIFVLKYISQE
jgi:membrane protein implicated in regulation of membrane protease activity